MSKSYFAVSARTAIGLARSGNEDSAITGSSLLAVADGMGGHAGGEVASRIAITTLAGMVPVLTAPDIDTDSIEDLLLNSLHTIDGEIAWRLFTKGIKREETRMKVQGNKDAGEHLLSMLTVMA